MKLSSLGMSLALSEARDEKENGEKAKHPAGRVNIHDLLLLHRDINRSNRYKVDSHKSKD